MNSSSEIAIIIPTMNRSEFVARQLAYYTSLICPHAIYVGDSSKGEHWDRTANAVNQLKDRINVIHEPLPDHNDTEAIMALLRLATERYAVFSGDDDFLVPDSLTRCAHYLETHPEISLIHGINSSFRLDVSGPYGRINTGGTHYGAHNVEHKTAAERLKAYLPNAFSTNFSLQRRQDFLATMETTLTMADRAFREILPNALRIVNGQAKRQDCFYLVRQSLGGSERVTKDAYDWLTNPDWQDSYLIFRHALAEALARHDGISEEEAQTVVKEAFWGYLNSRLVKHLDSRYATQPTGLSARARSAAKGVPLLRKAWRSMRSAKSPGAKDTYLDELLRRSSRYHADFMPVYRAISGPSPLLNGTTSHEAALQGVEGAS